MSNGTMSYTRTQEAEQTPFEPNRNPQWGGNPGPSGIVSTDVQSAIEEVRNFGSTTVNGNIFSVVFSELGVASNEWIETSASINSNHSFFVIPFTCKIAAVTYSNSNINADTQAKIVKSAYGSGLTYTVPLQITINDARIGVVNNIGSTISFNAGDKIGLFVSNIANNPSDLLVTVYFQVTSETVGNKKENFSGDFAGTPGTGTVVITL